ncbi:MAG: HDOD domain-containing protein [Armatimonadetes bacterium]|nr:HDOD domain-containing protein [Armatimonadota bacterium]
MELDVIALKIARNENLPALKTILTQVLALTDNPDASWRDLEKLIQQDPAISAKLLRAANSPYYGGHSVASVARAVTVLGFDVVRNLIIALSYQQMVGTSSRSASFDKMAYWRHCVATATAARIVGKLKMPSNAEELYGWGLMHDIGLLVLERHALVELESACKAAKANASSIDVELKAVLGYDHSSVGAMLAEKWNLPSGMRSAIEFHLEPERDTKHMETTIVVSIADQIARRIGYNMLGVKEDIEISTQYLAALDLAEDQLDVIEQVVLSEVQKAEAGFEQRAAA